MRLLSVILILGCVTGYVRGQRFSLCAAAEHAPRCPRYQGIVPKPDEMGGMIVGGFHDSECCSEEVHAAQLAANLKDSQIYGVTQQVVAGIIYVFFVHHNNKCCRVPVLEKLDTRHEVLTDTLCCDPGTCNSYVKRCKDH